ncbi:hypothetical protein SLEP1_g29911 [Rubroshorea leprosula]|uniref:Serine-threonine/tyrosine-protein kinase catalytic domain-containing protein n=1 Tax=Rubroshorea leprosula TaxID=152421 RepID=A0AAV5K4A3_9ROSI|nr:hypothetical protein SLEP1_g29911 [Rubroshorea leprosula]
MAPKCHITGKASKESDVYNFGVVALEVACGRRSIDSSCDELLVAWVWEAHGIKWSSIRQAIQVPNFVAALPNLPCKRPIPNYDISSTSVIEESEPNSLSITIPR